MTPSRMIPLVIELFAGTFGWSAGWLEMGGRAIGFDIKHLPYHGQVPPGAELVLQDVLTIHGSQFRNADLILASPPCQRYSYMAMPFSRGKRMAAEIRADQTGTKLRELNALFDACFRIQREASEAAGRYIPMVVENVAGAQRWVGRARWCYGSMYLWGDVPAIMPYGEMRKAVSSGWFNDHKRNGAILDNADRISYTSSRSAARKSASAQIARIPADLSRHIAQVYWPKGYTPS